MGRHGRGSSLGALGEPRTSRSERATSSWRFTWRFCTLPTASGSATIAASLAKRLVELREAGLLERREHATDDGREVLYCLTRQGKDVVPILTAFIQYGSIHHASQVFVDKKPRELAELYPEQQRAMLGRLRKYARRERK